MAYTRNHAISKVAVAGATGNLGVEVVRVLVGQGYTVTALYRSDSTSETCVGAARVDVDYGSRVSLENALQGQDAVVSVLPRHVVGDQMLLIDAAKAAGVKRFIPSEFGADLQNEKVRKLPVYESKLAMETYLETVATDYFTYTFIYTNVLLDWALPHGMILDVKNEKINFYDGGNQPFSATRICTAASAVAAVLSKLEATENRAVNIHDCALTQVKLLQWAKETFPTVAWATETVSTAVLEAGARERLESGVPRSQVLHTFALCAAFGQGYGGHFTSVDNEALGLEVLSDVDAEKATKDILKKL